MRLKKSVKFIVIAVIVVGIFVFIGRADADTEFVTPVTNGLCRMDVQDNGERANSRELQIAINDVAPGKRITSMEYCLASNDCDDESNWIDVKTYNPQNVISSYAVRVGTDDMTHWINVPKDHIKLRPVFTEFEPFDLSYKKFTPTVDYGDNRELFEETYYDGMFDMNNFETGDYHNLVTGYKGGDVVLPTDLTANGGLIKITFTNENYNAYKARFDEAGMDGPIVDLSSMFNHLQDYWAGDTAKVLTVSRDSDEPYVEDTATTKSFFIYISQRFFETNRSEFTVGDNFNRIISTEYIGLDYNVDRKYFDENASVGFLTFNQFNEYSNSTYIFYGTPEVHFYVDSVKPVALADGGSANLGTLAHPYDTIVSGDQETFPITNNNLAITDFYRQENIVPIVLKNGNTVVQNVLLNIERFAFSDATVRDSNGEYCHRENPNADCTHLYVEYRGLYDTFYSNDTMADTIKAFWITDQPNFGLIGEGNDNQAVYRRDTSFNPWGLAVYYHDDTVVSTQSFNLGEIVKIEGYTDEVIPEATVNGHAHTWGGDPVDDYDSSQYQWFGYGMGYEQPMNKIAYFNADDYHKRNISYPIEIATKEFIENNQITRIAFFLTNGELKSDEANFPELTYGVGEGKIYELDHRTFEGYVPEGGGN